MNIGCVAPSSIANFPDNTAVWLGREGFYRSSPDGQMILVSQGIQKITDRINPAYAKGACAVFDPKSGEYRCWVPLDGDTENSTCLVYDGKNWRRRTSETAASVCVTRDHRKLLLAAGKARSTTETSTTGNGSNGVWVIDHETIDFFPEARKHIIETGWIEWARSSQRKTTKTIYLGLRERYYGSAKISVYRDFRKNPVVYEDSTNAKLYKEEDRPAFWSHSIYSTYTATFPASTSTTGGEVPVNTRYDSFHGDQRDQRMVVPRPYWKKIDVEVPSCEVYKILIETEHPMEFIGIMVDEEPKPSISSRVS